ncbi:hypothetical protein HDU98_000927 [Podochytrium sp. JEL0797]|nr:hypothetical protein HDU98_000927 [Podochytrium sp. JEL0797]
MIFDSIGIPTTCHPTPTITTATTQRHSTSTVTGFVKEPYDASLVIAAIVSGALQALNAVPMSLSDLRIESGTVLVFAENSSMGQMVRWRDGKRWSASRLQGPFLLYREVEASSNSSPSTTTSPSSTHPEQEARFQNTVVRGKTKFVPNGLAKRTLTLTGSDGNRYRVISYFYPADVAHLYGDPPGGGVAGGKRLETPSRMRQFERFLGDEGVVVPVFTMPDLSFAAVRRGLVSESLKGVAAGGGGGGVGGAGVKVRMGGIVSPPSLMVESPAASLTEDGSGGEVARGGSGASGFGSVIRAPRNTASSSSHARISAPHSHSHAHSNEHSNHHVPTNHHHNTNSRYDHSPYPSPLRQHCVVLPPLHIHQRQFDVRDTVAAVAPLRKEDVDACACACGGLTGAKDVEGMFKRDPFWTEFPVVLAPLRGNT